MDNQRAFYLSNRLEPQRNPWAHVEYSTSHMAVSVGLQCVPPAVSLHPASSIIHPPSSILHPPSSILNPPSTHHPFVIRPTTQLICCEGCRGREWCCQSADRALHSTKLDSGCTLQIRTRGVATPPTARSRCPPLQEKVICTRAVAGACVSVSGPLSSICAGG